MWVYSRVFLILSRIIQTLHNPTELLVFQLMYKGESIFIIQIWEI